MFDVDKFIQIVEENPAIWEKGTKEYSDRNLREKSWNVVGENMFSNWSDMTYEERSDQGIVVYSVGRVYKNVTTRPIPIGQ